VALSNKIYINKLVIFEHFIAKLLISSPKRVVAYTFTYPFIFRIHGGRVGNHSPGRVIVYLSAYPPTYPFWLIFVFGNKKRRLE
jgi:hypothetical protein